MGHAFRWLIAHRLRVFGLYVLVLGALALSYPVLGPLGWGQVAIFAAIVVIVGVEFGQVIHNARDRAARGVSLIDRVVAEKARTAQPMQAAPSAPDMIDHTGITTPDFARAKAFYTAALAPLGHGFLHTVPPEHTGGAAVGGFGRDRPQFWISDGAPQMPPIHLAFGAATRAQVDAFHAAALEAGGTDNGAPGLRPHYHPDYYGAFVLDPDGNNIEAVCHRPAAPTPPRP